MAANQTTITVSTRIGRDTNTLVTGFALPASSVEAMLLLSAAEITEKLNVKGANIFKPINGLGVLPHFRVEDGTHCLFASERREKVGATFGGAIANKDVPIIDQISAELEEESVGQFRFAKDAAGQFCTNEKGQFIILCRQRTTLKKQDGTFSHEYTEKKLALEFDTIPNHFVDNRQSAIDVKTNKPVGFNMSFLTVQAEISGLTKEELSMLANDKSPTAKLWNRIFVELNKFRSPRECKDWGTHWSNCKDDRNAAKERISALYIRLQKKYGAFLVEPADIFKTQNVEEALTNIFDNISSEKEYYSVLNEKVGSYSESPASTIVTSDAVKAVANIGEAPLADINGTMITYYDEKEKKKKPVTGGFVGYAMKQLEFPQPRSVSVDEKKVALYGSNYRYGKFSPPPASSPSSDVNVKETRAPSPTKTR